MAKYHNGPNGPGICRAKPGNCPFGGDEAHFDTLEEAQEYADKINEKEHGIIAGVPGVRRVFPGNNVERYVDSNTPEFYQEHDDVLERFHEFTEEFGPESYDHVSFSSLDDVEKYGIWSDDFTSRDYLEAYNDSYTEKDFDYLKDDIAEHYVKEGVFKDKQEVDNRISELGKEKFFQEFNNFVIMGERPSGTNNESVKGEPSPPVSQAVQIKTTEHNDFTGYDKSVAEAHLSNYGTIFVDDYGYPIDNEFKAEEIYERYKKESR